MTVPCCICQVLLQSVFNSSPCVVKPVYALDLCVIYAAASAGGEQAEKKSMTPSAAYLWLQRTLWVSAGWETGLQQGREVGGWGGGLICNEEWHGELESPESGPQGGAEEKWYEMHVDISKGYKGMVAWNLTQHISQRAVFLVTCVTGSQVAEVYIRLT